MVNLFTGVFENPYILALKKEIAMSNIRMQNRNNRPTYKEMDNTKPFPKQLKSDVYGYYRCSFCGEGSNDSNSKFIWAEDINKHYKEHYICGTCIAKWEKN